MLRSDLLLARANGRLNENLKSFKREISILPKSSTLAQAFNEVLRVRTHIVQVVDEFGSPIGILTLEDIVETLLGLEIVDEEDATVNMREEARHVWKRRARYLWLDFGKEKEPD